MKTQLKNIKTKTSIKLLLPVITATLLLATSCKKTSPLTSQNNDTTQLTPQEKALLGKWQTTKIETYEVDGVDSTGQYMCSLIGISLCDSACNLELKNELNFQALNKQLSGSGSIDSCGAIQQFKWKCTAQNLFEIRGGNTYNILYLTKDSTAFSRVYINDILLLKSITYYKRCQ